MSSSKFVEQCVVKGIAEAADQVALADQEMSEEIKRLVDAGNELIKLSSSFRGRRS